MDDSFAQGLLPSIQLSITPVILITGLGSLLLTMTNRMGRVVDRTRVLAGQVRAAAPGEEQDHIAQQLRILYRRAKIVRRAVTLGAASMFCSGVLVIMIFLNTVVGPDLSLVIVGVFTASILCLLGALGAFLSDIFLSLNALGLEVERALGPDKSTR
jgi:hypothetical protein